MSVRLKRGVLWLVGLAVCVGLLLVAFIWHVTSDFKECGKLQGEYISSDSERIYTVSTDSLYISDARTRVCASAFSLRWQSATVEATATDQLGYSRLLHLRFLRNGSDYIVWCMDDNCAVDVIRKNE